MGRPKLGESHRQQPHPARLPTLLPPELQPYCAHTCATLMPVRTCTYQSLPAWGVEDPREGRGLSRSLTVGVTQTAGGTSHGQDSMPPLLAKKEVGKASVVSWPRQPIPAQPPLPRSGHLLHSAPGEALESREKPLPAFCPGEGGRGQPLCSEDPWDHQEMSLRGR